MGDPSEQDVTQVIEIAGLDYNDRDLVRQALKSNSGSVENVINEYFNDGDGFRRKYSSAWDETMFNSNRDDTNMAPNSFHIEGPNELMDVSGAAAPDSVGFLGAPSRPPSRNNNRSPMSRVADWTAANAGVPNYPAQNTQEDDDMQRALRESAQLAGIEMPQQESGVMEPPAYAAQFGPAQRDHYDDSQWAVVPAQPASVSIESKTTPSQRRREPGQPAFLIQGPSAFGEHRLGALLTIMHEIPLIRNVLLQTGTTASSYGHNSLWWNGSDIVPPHVLAQMESTPDDYALEAEAVNFEEEVHRILAFLDSTERSHGNASSLTSLLRNGSLGVEKDFYDTVIQRNDSMASPFHHNVIVTNTEDKNRGADADGDGDVMDTVKEGEIEDLETETARFCVLECNTLRRDLEGVDTLYQLLDTIVWSDMLSLSQSPDDARMAMFQDLADVITIDMTGQGPARSIEIPEEFYPERWMENRKEEAVKIQRALRQAAESARRLTEAKVKHYRFDDLDAGVSHDKRNVAIQAKERFDADIEYLKGRGRFRTIEESGFDLDQFPDYHAAPVTLTEEEEQLQRKLQEAADYSQRLLDDGRQQMEELNKELDRIKAKQTFLAKLLTQPDKPGRPKPFACKKYLLQGIATSRDTVYVCRRVREDLIELDEGPKAADQWWRLAYNSEDRIQPVKIEALSYAQAHERVWEDTKTPLLVYASEQAMSADPIPLPPALERFVKADNKAFRQELQQEQTSLETVPEEPSPTEIRSPKRKHRADSMDSMASNRASVGSEAGGANSDPFIDTFNEDASLGSGRKQSRADSPLRGESMHVDNVEEMPTLPQRHQVSSTENTSTTLTPNTQALGEDGSLSSRGTQLTTPPLSREATTEPDQARSPEMQERHQMPMLKRFLSGEDAEGKKDRDTEVKVAEEAMNMD